MTKSSNGKAKPRAYTGELAQPIYEPILWASYSNGLERRKWLAEQGAIKRQLAKLEHLFDWYNVDDSADDRWFRLAFALAEEHVPGLRVIYDRKPQRGPRKTWDTGRYEQLFQGVNEIRSTRKITTKAAIKLLIADAAGAWHKSDPNSLNTRYREAVREHKKRRVLEEKAKLNWMPIPTSVNLSSRSGSLFTTSHSYTLPSKIPFKRKPTE